MKIKKNYYAPWAIDQYLKELPIKYIEIVSENGEFVCVLDADEFRNNNENIEKMVSGINQDKIKTNLKGLIISDAIKENSRQYDVYIKLKKSTSDFLPVLDTNNKLVGILTKSALQEQMLDDVMGKLNLANY